MIHGAGAPPVLEPALPTAPVLELALLNALANELALLTAWSAELALLAGLAIELEMRALAFLIMLELPTGPGPTVIQLALSTGPAVELTPTGSPVQLALLPGSHAFPRLRDSN